MSEWPGLEHENYPEREMFRPNLDHGVLESKPLLRELFQSVEKNPSLAATFNSIQEDTATDRLISRLQEGVAEEDLIELLRIGEILYLMFKGVIARSQSNCLLPLLMAAAEKEKILPENMADKISESPNEIASLFPEEILNCAKDRAGDLASYVSALYAEYQSLLFATSTGD